VNGKLAPDSFGAQLDETAYPLLMADQLHLTDHALYEQHIKPAANFVAAHGPSFGVERWEEQSGYSPSTIAAEIAGLIAAADLADANNDPASAAIWRGTADDFQRSIKSWTLTTTGPFAPRYFIRLSKTGDPNAAITYNVGNGGPTLDQRQVIDQGFLELTRLGELRAADPDILASLPVVDAKIRSPTSAGDGFHRYNGDGYGDRASDGRPWAPSGQGSGQPSARSSSCRPATPPAPHLSSTAWPGWRAASGSSPSRTGRTRTSHPRRSVPIRPLGRSGS
jgi:glucoamylase